MNKARSPSSLLDFVRSISKIQETQGQQTLTLGIDEYYTLIEELWKADAFLNETYTSHQMIPRIYTLYGVKIEIA